MSFIVYGNRHGGTVYMSASFKDPKSAQELCKDLNSIDDGIQYVVKRIKGD